MHRGSSKGARPPGREPETLPLSASPDPVDIELEITRAGRIERRTIALAIGQPISAALRSAGLAPEGCAVLEGSLPRPLDHPISGPTRLTVIPTFSGG